jgi:hypothetical protein
MSKTERRNRATGSAAMLASLLLFATQAAADTFAKVYYDRATDQLVVTMHYRGTNPDHRFSLQWGGCKAGTDERGAEVAGLVVDSQASDAARMPFDRTTRFDLTDMPCRPAKLTLRTAPRFAFAIQIPATP